MNAKHQLTASTGSESCNTMKGGRASKHQEAALHNARNGNSLLNYRSIFDGFKALGIPDEDIQPRVNIFTFNAWKQLGRVVSKGQHGVRVCTFVHAVAARSDARTKETSFRMPRQTTVFHITQTEPISQ